MSQLSIKDRMTVTVPEGEYQGMRITRFEIKPHDLGNLRAALRGGRGTRPGRYTKLTSGGTFWMSDTDAEKSDHWEAVQMISDPNARRVMINGLGLGMVLAAALSFDHVEQVDVIERDERVIKLVGPHYTPDPRVTIHHADAYEQAKRWESGTRWDVGWSDIWPELCTDNLADMARLNRAYGHRCTWHRCWGTDTLKRLRDQERRDDRWVTGFVS